MLPFPHLSLAKKLQVPWACIALCRGLAYAPGLYCLGALSVPPGIRLCLLMLTFSPETSEVHSAESSDFEEKPTAGGQQGRDE